MLPPWYDAVVAWPSGAQVNGVLLALEWNPSLHDIMQICLCLPWPGHWDPTTIAFAGKLVGRSQVASSQALWPPAALDPAATTPK